MSDMKYYKAQEAAKLLKIAPSSLRVYASSEKRGNRLTPVPHDRLPEQLQAAINKGDLVFSQEELDRFQKARRKVGRKGESLKSRPQTA